jgi:hypothetical protein
MDSNILSLATLLISILALALASYNLFKINYNKKIRDVNLINQKDDIYLSMESIKVSLQKDIRKLEKDINKVEVKAKPKSTTTKSKISDKKDNDDKSSNKPVKKRPYNRKKPIQKNTSNQKKE